MTTFTTADGLVLHEWRDNVFVSLQMTADGAVSGDVELLQTPMAAQPIIPGREFALTYRGTTGDTVRLVADGISDTAPDSITDLGGGYVKAVWNTISSNITSGKVGLVTVGGVPVYQAVVASVTTSSTIASETTVQLAASGKVQIVSAVASDGQTLGIIRGDSYEGDNAIEWTGETADQWPDLSGATLKFRAASKFAADEISGVPTVVTPTGTQKFKLELSKTDTKIRSGKYSYDVQAELADGRVRTLVRNGTMTVERTLTDP